MREGDGGLAGAAPGVQAVEQSAGGARIVHAAEEVLQALEAREHALYLRLPANRSEKNSVA